jgi:hypothetical protein
MAHRDCAEALHAARLAGCKAEGDEACWRAHGVHPSATACPDGRASVVCVRAGYSDELHACVREGGAEPQVVYGLAQHGTLTRGGKTG